jgi:hypothetical protein
MRRRIGWITRNAFLCLDPLAVSHRPEMIAKQKPPGASPRRRQWRDSSARKSPAYPAQPAAAALASTGAGAEIIRKEEMLHGITTTRERSAARILTAARP